MSQIDSNAEKAPNLAENRQSPDHSTSQFSNHLAQVLFYADTTPAESPDYAKFMAQQADGEKSFGTQLSPEQLQYLKSAVGSVCQAQNLEPTLKNFNAIVLAGMAHFKKWQRFDAVMSMSDANKRPSKLEAKKRLQQPLLSQLPQQDHSQVLDPLLADNNTKKLFDSALQALWAGEGQFRTYRQAFALRTFERAMARILPPTNTNPDLKLQ